MILFSVAERSFDSIIPPFIFGSAGTVVSITPGTPAAASAPRSTGDSIPASCARASTEVLIFWISSTTFCGRGVATLAALGSLAGAAAALILSPAPWTAPAAPIMSPSSNFILATLMSFFASLIFSTALSSLSCALIAAFSDSVIGELSLISSILYFL